MIRGGVVGLKEQNVPYVGQYATSDAVVRWRCVVVPWRLLTRKWPDGTAVEQPLTNCDVLFPRVAEDAASRDGKLSAALCFDRVVAA
jgi:hypothetical protein